MAVSDHSFAGSIPDLYDRYLVPLIFEPYARDLTARIAKTNPGAILETAAGTGVLTRAIVASLPDVRIVASDLNQPMLDRAKARQSYGDVEWKQADAMSLPFEDQSFDIVACQFGAMFFPDKVQGYQEAGRVLKRGGHFFFSVWDQIAENEFADTVTNALTTLFPDDPPRFMTRTPHGYHDVARIRGDLEAAGFEQVVIEAVEARSTASSPRHAAMAYCQGTPLRSEIEARGALDEATERATEALARRFGEGAIDGRIRAFVVTAAR